MKMGNVKSPPAVNASLRAGHQWRFYLYASLVSLFCALYLESYYEIYTSMITERYVGIFFLSPTLGSILRLALVFAVLLGIILILARHRHIARWIVNHRYPIAFGVIALLMLLRLGGTSTAFWGEALGETPRNGTLFGMPRPIRSDEWLVSTPFAFAQSVTGNHPISEVIRGSATNVTLVTAQPTWSFSSIFRPYYWGYLLFGSEFGVSFFWNFKAVTLIVVTFDCLCLVTHRNRRAAAFGALLIGFAPLIEWWSLGGSEILIFGQGLVLSLHYFLRSSSNFSRWGWSALLAWLLGCYAFVLYPAWQVPMVYVFAAWGILDVVLWFKNSPRTPVPTLLKQTVVPLVVCCVIVAAFGYVAVRDGLDVVQIVSNTAYPGHRFENGGGFSPLMFNPVTTIASPLWADLYLPNVCEVSAFISLFPIGLILSLVILVLSFMRHKPDLWIVASLIPYAFLLAFAFIGFPDMISRITFMSNVTVNRLPLAFGFLDIALLARCVALIDDKEENLFGAKLEPIKKYGVFVGAALVVLYALVMTCLANGQSTNVVFPKSAIVIISALVLLTIPIALPSSWMTASGHDRQSWMLTSTAVVICIGLCINPLQIGASALTDSPLLKSVSEISKKDPDAKWITDSTLLGQACVSAGVPVVTTIHPYPNLDLWHKFDPDGTHENEYNRYAHVAVTLGDHLEFENPINDALLVTLPPDDVPKLGATYWLSNQNLEKWNTDVVSFIPETQVRDDLTVYRIVDNTTKAPTSD